MAENPPLNRIYVLGYSANDRDYPIVSLNADPRVAGYKVPEDLSTCPDKRYPNHVFTGAQPISGDERVRHVWEILPSPWVPFTRYDDDLGPIQGRRRSVKNEGQVASLTANKRTTYEAREGSAIVYTELEETWEIKVDEDGNSLFPIRDRDFYDASRGPVQERRQLFVPTGDEVGSLENVSGVITQTSYEPYNEFLSVKIVQTYKVDGPQLIGKATDNDGQLVTVTTQRKGAQGYVPPNPTATRTVEVSREDAESLVERIVDTPEVFKANTFSLERPDPIPQKFRVAVPLESSQEIVSGTAQMPSLSEGEISRTEEQRNKFLKRITATSRDQTVLPKTLTSRATDQDRQRVTITETLQLGNTNEVPTATKTVESEALGDGNYIVRKTEVPEIFEGTTFSVERPDFIPQKFRVAVPSVSEQKNIAGEAVQPTLSSGDIAKSEQQINKFVKRVSATTRSDTKLPQTLTQKATNQEKQLVTITETLQSGDTNEQPTSRIDIQSEALGDGKYIVTKTQAPEVFKAQTYRAERADLTPPKFRAKQTDLVTEENVEGEAQEPSLGENEFLKSEQQINKFVKRVTTNTRNTELNESLNELVITPEGQLGTRTITLSNSGQELVPSETLIDGEVEELGDGRTIKTEITVPAPFNAKQESLEKPEVIPPEFRASLQNRTVSEIKTGQSVEIPSLDEDEVSKTIQRITEHKIRETKTTRPTTEYPKLSGEFIDNDLIKVSRVKTLAKGKQEVTPSATISGTVEAIGDGYTLKTEDKKDKLFNAKTFSQERPDNIPVEFRVEKPAKTEEFNEEGTATEVSLVETEISKSEQQVNEFVKRVRRTTREDVGVAVLDEEQIDQDGVKISVKRSLIKGGQNITPSSRVSGQVQNLGGGYTIKTELTKDKVFNSLTKSATKPDTIPEKFRANSPVKRTEEIVESTEATEPTLNENEYSKTEQRITEFTVQKTTVEREENLNETENQRLEENWGIQIPYKEYIAGSIPSGDNYEGEGLDDKNHLVREYDKRELESTLSLFSVEIPTSIDLDLPRVLKDITVNWEETKASSSNQSENPQFSGQFTNLTQQDGGRIQSTLSLAPSVNVEFEDIWGKNLPATIHLFFLQKENLNNSQIVSKIGATASWPVFKPKSFYTTIFGKTETKSIEASISRALQINNTPAEYGYVPSKSFSEISSAQVNPISINIAPCLTSGITINKPKTITADALNIEIKYQAVSINVSSGSIQLDPVEINQPLTHTLECNAQFTIPQTIPPDIPRSGRYLISSSAEPYKFGWFLVRAISFDASILN